MDKYKKPRVQRIPAWPARERTVDGIRLLAENSDKQLSAIAQRAFAAVVGGLDGFIRRRKTEKALVSGALPGEFNPEELTAFF